MKLIGVAGGSGSGKTTFASKLHEQIGKHRSVIIAQDAYYRDQSKHFDKDGGKVNFDHPDSIDWPLMLEQLKHLKSGLTISYPIYDFTTHSRRTDSVPVAPTEYIILDGILIYSQEYLVEMIDHRIYIDCSEQVRFSRREKRDVVERGRTPEGVRSQLLQHVKPMHDLFVEPSKELAHHIVSGEGPFEESLKKTLEKILKK